MALSPYDASNPIDASNFSCVEADFSVGTSGGANYAAFAQDYAVAGNKFIHLVGNSFGNDLLPLFAGSGTTAPTGYLTITCEK